MANEFAARTSVEQVEEGAELAPKFDADGLIPAVTTDAANGELLMVGYMNAEALRKTIETGEAHYWSRSRQVLWHKGATSGLVQKVTELMIDDDQDCVWLKVAVAGGASCHVGYRTCFYRRIPLGNELEGARVHGDGKGVRSRRSSTATRRIPPSSELRRIIRFDYCGLVARVGEPHGEREARRKACAFRRQTLHSTSTARVPTRRRRAGYL